MSTCHKIETRRDMAICRVSAEAGIPYTHRHVRSRRQEQGINDHLGTGAVSNPSQQHHLFLPRLFGERVISSRHALYFLPACLLLFAKTIDRTQQETCKSQGKPISRPKSLPLYQPFRNEKGNEEI
jgi:hypothetical protein